MASEKFGSLRKLSQELEIPYSTAKNYASEIIFLPEGLFEKILNLVGIVKEDLNPIYLPFNWGMSLGARRGMATLQKKYPEKLLEWRRKGSRNSSIVNTKRIKTPRLSEKLAEFIGVYLGDGTLNEYQIRITGDYRYDLFYFKHLSNLVSELFGLSSSIKKESKHNTVNLTISSKSLCSYLNKEFRLKFGNKILNKTVIPKKIIADKKLAIACLRGLIDTDGSVSRRGRAGSQFCLQFTSHNKELLRQVDGLGRDLGIFTFSGITGAGTNKWENIIKYFRVVGSSNLRHIVRFYERYSKGNTIYQKEVVNYYHKGFYKSIILPFKLGRVV